MGKMEREKGKRYEREVAARLREAFPELADKIVRSIQSRGAENDDVAGLPGWWIECQNATTPTPRDKLEQAERDSAGTGRICVAVIRKTNSKIALVYMRLGDLVRWTQQAMVVFLDAEIARTMVSMPFEEWIALVQVIGPPKWSGVDGSRNEQNPNRPPPNPVKARSAS